MEGTLLIADDDRQQRRYLSAVLSSAGYGVECVEGGEAALERLNARNCGDISLCLLDLHMPDLDGIGVLKRLRAEGNNIPVIVLTSDGSVSRAVEAMQAGANDFIVKPAGPERLDVSIRNTLAMNALGAEVRRLSRRESDTLSFDDLIATSESIQDAIKMSRKAARSDIPVLIEGESGTGKEVFARAIHGDSDRSGRPFVAVNCGALPGTLIESILFGHEKGAFTGATSRRPGKFKEASGGTLFLDEIGELPMEAQVKLLRAIQTGEIDPVGATGSTRVDIRLISASNRDLRRMVIDGKFREDLYYRISVFPVKLPPLRERRADIGALANMFLSRYATAEDSRIQGFSQAATEAIRAADWPGNVRHLENTIHRAVVLADEPLIRPEHLVGILSDPEPDDRRGNVTSLMPGYGETGKTRVEDPLVGPDGHIRQISEIEAEAIRRALAMYRGRMAEVARRLGIGRSTLYRKLDELDIQRADAS